MTLSGQVYKCSTGETFDSIALTEYGDERYSCELLFANPALCTVSVFAGGEILQLPVVELPDEDEDQDEDYMAPTAPWKE